MLPFHTDFTDKPMLMYYFLVCCIDSVFGKSLNILHWP